MKLNFLIKFVNLSLQLVNSKFFCVCTVIWALTTQKNIDLSLSSRNTQYYSEWSNQAAPPPTLNREYKLLFTNKRLCSSSNPPSGLSRRNPATHHQEGGLITPIAKITQRIPFISNVLTYIFYYFYFLRSANTLRALFRVQVCSGRRSFLILIRSIHVVFMYSFLSKTFFILDSLEFLYIYSMFKL